MIARRSNLTPEPAVERTDLDIDAYLAGYVDGVFVATGNKDASTNPGIQERLDRARDVLSRTRRG